MSGLMSPADVQVRVARPEEHGAVAEVTVAAYAALLGEDQLGDYEQSLRDVDGRAAYGAVLVAVLDDRVVGAVSYVAGADTPFSEFEDHDACGIRMLAVDPSHQGNGIGRALTEACLERARTEERGRVVLHSTDKMAVARGLYERLGFARTPARDVVIPGDDLPDGRPFTLLAYVLELAPS